jgi:hypothetical protein
MSFKTTVVALAATAMLGTIGASQAYAGSPQCGVFDDNSGTISVTTEGRQFSFSQLLNEGRLSGRGPQFGCWAEIGTSSEIRGTLMYAYRVTDPKGQSIEFGPYGIQAGGFGSGSIAINASQVGTWRVEYLTVSRDNGAKASIGSTTFKLTP